MGEILSKASKRLIPLDIKYIKIWHSVLSEPMWKEQIRN
jgi:hypothetical protein